jgi:hypothetical protein
MNFSLGDSFCPFCFVIFGTFNALQYCLHSSSHHENEAIAWPIVGRTKLCAVLNCNATGGASTYINQATTTLEGRHRIIYGGIYRRQGWSYGCASGELSVIHSHNHIAGGP